MRPARSTFTASLVALTLALATRGHAAVPAAAILLGRAVLARASLPGEVRVFVDLANRHRASLGLPPLVWDADAARVAQAHSEDMVARRYFAHLDPDGRRSAQRLTEASIGWSTAGENIAFGYDDGGEVFEAWMASPGHRANLENPAFRRHGVGLDQGRWTHVLYAP
jgi:uncharacterized protein YkwD